MEVGEQLDLKATTKLRKDFGDTNSEKVNLNLLSDDDIRTYTIGADKSCNGYTFQWQNGSKNRFILIMIFLTGLFGEILRGRLSLYLGTSRRQCSGIKQRERWIWRFWRKYP